MTVLIGLQAGQSRRVSDQLTLSLTDSNHPEVDNDLACFDSSGRQIGDESNGGTNDQAVSALVMRASMILTADHTDTYQCKIFAVNTDSKQAIARAGTSLTQGTFLDVDNFTADLPGEWEGPFCPSNDSQPPPWPTCLYFGGGQFAPTNSRILFDDGPASTWTAGPDATSVDVAGQLQVTSRSGLTRPPPLHGSSGPVSRSGLLTASSTRAQPAPSSPRTPLPAQLSPLAQRSISPPRSDPSPCPTSKARHKTLPSRLSPPLA